MADDLTHEIDADAHYRHETERVIADLTKYGPQVTRSGDEPDRLFTPDPTRNYRHQYGRDLLERRQLGRVTLGYFDQLLVFEKFAEAGTEFGPYIALASVIVEAGLDKLVTARARAAGLFPALLGAMTRHADRHSIEVKELAGWASGKAPTGRSPEPTLFTHQAVTRALCYGVLDGNPELTAFAATVFPATCQARLRDLSFAAAVDLLRRNYRNKTSHVPTREYRLADYRAFTELAVGAGSFIAWDLYVAGDESPADAAGIINPLARGGASAR